MLFKKERNESLSIWSILWWFSTSWFKLIPRMDTVLCLILSKKHYNQQLGVKTQETSLITITLKHATPTSVSFLNFRTMYHTTWDSQVAEWLRICLPMQESQKTSAQSLGQEYPRREMTTHSSILSWAIPQIRGSWQATVHRVAKSQTWLRMHAPDKQVTR